MTETKLPLKYNWETAHNPLIKKYVADLHQDGSPTPPVVTELVNNTGLYFQYYYVDPGVYAVVASKNVFDGATGQKVQATITNSTFLQSGGWSATVFPVSVNTLIILTSDTISLVDQVLGYYAQNTLEITVYP